LKSVVFIAGRTTSAATWSIFIETRKTLLYQPDF